MAEDTDLLPWILGGLSAATVAIAITVGASNGGAPNGTAPDKSHVATPTTALSLPGAEAIPQATVALSRATASLSQVPAIAPTPAPNLSGAQIQTAATPTQPTSQIWQCTINGQKTFSDAPCGDKASVREIGPINTMDPSPVLSHAPSYGREPSYQPEYPGEQADSNAAEQQLAGNSYPVFVGIPIHESRRPEHAHRPHEHNRGPQPRRN